jgi:predicted RecB family endonuclease
MVSRKFDQGMRWVEVTHYDVGVRRKVEFTFDGMDTVDVDVVADHHGMRPAVKVSAGIALNEEEMRQLIAKLTEIHAQMVSERKEQEEWEAKHSQ